MPLPSEIKTIPTPTLETLRLQFHALEGYAVNDALQLAEDQGAHPMEVANSISGLWDIVAQGYHDHGLHARSRECKENSDYWRSVGVEWYFNHTW